MTKAQQPHAQAMGEVCEAIEFRRPCETSC